MFFLNPLFAWGFLSLGVILALYLLKRRYEIRPVPSTFLWKKTGQDLSASRPFQRLRKNILLPIQLLMAAILVLTLMRPTLPGNVGGETVMIFDLSASMQTEIHGENRVEEAVEAAKGMIDGMNSGDALTILAVDNETRQLLTRSTDREAAYRALKKLEPSNCAGDISSAVSLAQAMEREVGGLNIIVFSDEYTPPEGVAVRNASQGADNRAITSFNVQDGVGYARVINYGSDAEITLACYAEGKLCDARVLEIPSGESAGTALEVPECRWAYVEIQESDGIDADNRLYYIAERQKNYTVALSGDGSVFLEHAVGLREDIQIVRVAEDEMASVAADLYIYGESPLFFSLDPEQTAIQAGEEAAPEGKLTLTGGENAIMGGLSLLEVAVRAYRPLIGGDALMTIDGQNVMAANGRTVALGFDIHETNLPMKYDFSILVQNILHNLLPENAAEVGDGICGEIVTIPLTAEYESAEIETPS